jgi:membrane fusion protein (multidrug efflux system)
MPTGPTTGRRPAAPAAAAAVALFLLAGCGQKQPAAPAAAPAPAVTVTPARREPVSRTAKFVGRVQAIGILNLKARVSGFLEKRLFTEGQDVKVGDLLFVIEQEPYQAQVEQRKAELASAKAGADLAAVQLRRAQEVAARQPAAVSQSEIDQRKAEDAQADAAVQQAQAALHQVQINLGYTKIYAPIAGHIGRSIYTVGTLVGPDSGTLATIVDQNPIYVIFPVSQSQILAYRRRVAERGGEPEDFVVHLTLSDGSTYRYPGKINFLSVRVDPGTNTESVRAEFPNPERILVDGEYVGVTVEGQTPASALVVPQAAVQMDQGGSYVLVVGADDKVEQRPIELGANTGSDVVVSKGLNEGERVIVEGIQNVQPGQKVAPHLAKPSPPEGQPTGSGASQQGASDGSQSTMDEGQGSGDGSPAASSAAAPTPGDPTR